MSYADSQGFEARNSGLLGIQRACTLLSLAWLIIDALAFLGFPSSIDDRLLTRLNLDPGATLCRHLAACLSKLIIYTVKEIINNDEDVRYGHRATRNYHKLAANAVHSHPHGSDLPFFFQQIAFFRAAGMRFRNGLLHSTTTNQEGLTAGKPPWQQRSRNAPNASRMASSRVLISRKF